MVIRTQSGRTIGPQRRFQEVFFRGVKVRDDVLFTDPQTSQVFRVRGVSGGAPSVETIQRQIREGSIRPDTGVTAGEITGQVRESIRVGLEREKQETALVKEARRLGVRASRKQVARAQREERLELVTRHKDQEALKLEARRLNILGRIPSIRARAEALQKPIEDRPITATGEALELQQALSSVGKRSAVTERGTLIIPTETGFEEIGFPTRARTVAEARPLIGGVRGGDPTKPTAFDFAEFPTLFSQVERKRVMDEQKQAKQIEKSMASTSLILATPTAQKFEKGLSEIPPRSLSFRERTDFALRRGISAEQFVQEEYRGGRSRLRDPVPSVFAFRSDLPPKIPMTKGQQRAVELTASTALGYRQAGRNPVMAAATLLALYPSVRVAGFGLRSLGFSAKSSKLLVGGSLLTGFFGYKALHDPTVFTTRTGVISTATEFGTFGLAARGIIGAAKVGGKFLPLAGSGRARLVSGTYQPPVTVVEKLATVSKRSSVVTYKIGPAFTSPDVGTRATPMQMVTHLQKIRKITYQPATFKLDPGTRGSYYRYAKPLPEIKISGGVSREFHELPKGISHTGKLVTPRDVTVAHELVHHYTPGGILNLARALPYRTQPAELLAFGLEKQVASRGLKISVAERALIQKSLEGASKTFSVRRGPFARLMERALVPEKTIGGKGPAVTVTRGTVRRGFSEYDVDIVAVGRRVSGSIRKISGLGPGRPSQQVVSRYDPRLGIDVVRSIPGKRTVSTAGPDAVFVKSTTGKLRFKILEPLDLAARPEIQNVVVSTKIFRFPKFQQKGLATDYLKVSEAKRTGPFGEQLEQGGQRFFIYDPTKFPTIKPPKGAKGFTGEARLRAAFSKKESVFAYREAAVPTSLKSYTTKAAGTRISSQVVDAQATAGLKRTVFGLDMRRAPFDQKIQPDIQLSLNPKQQPRVFGEKFDYVGKELLKIRQMILTPEMRVETTTTARSFTRFDLTESRSSFFKAADAQQKIQVLKDLVSRGISKKGTLRLSTDTSKMIQDIKKPSPIKLEVQRPKQRFVSGKKVTRFGTSAQTLFSLVGKTQFPYALPIALSVSRTRVSTRPEIKISSQTKPRSRVSAIGKVRAEIQPKVKTIPEIIPVTVTKPELKTDLKTDLIINIPVRIPTRPGKPGGPGVPPPPPPPPPPAFPFKFGDPFREKKKKRKKKRGRRRRVFQPSLEASAFVIRGPRPRVLTGLALRPIPLGRRPRINV